MQGNKSSAVEFTKICRYSNLLSLRISKLSPSVSLSLSVCLSISVSVSASFSLPLSQANQLYLPCGSQTHISIVQSLTQYPIYDKIFKRISLIILFFASL